MPNPNPPTNGFDKRPEDINHDGRPKREWTWLGMLEEVADNEIDIRKPDGTIEKKKLKEVVAKRIWSMAAGGDIQAIKEIFNRMDGTPIQHTDLTSGGEKIESPILYVPPEKK